MAGTTEINSRLLFTGLNRRRITTELTIQAGEPLFGAFLKDGASPGFTAGSKVALTYVRTTDAATADKVAELNSPASVVSSAAEYQATGIDTTMVGAHGGSQ